MPKKNPHIRWSANSVLLHTSKRRPQLQDPVHFDRKAAPTVGELHTNENVVHGCGLLLVDRNAQGLQARCNQSRALVDLRWGGTKHDEIVKVASQGHLGGGVELHSFTPVAHETRLRHPCRKQRR